MNKMTFIEFSEAYSLAYEAGDLLEAYRINCQRDNLLDVGELEKNAYTIFLDGAKFKSKLKLYDECWNDLEYLIEKKYLCPLHWGMFSDPFIHNELFLKLKEKNDCLREELQAKTNVVWEVLLPPNYVESEKSPVFISLHGDEDSYVLHKKYWKAEKLLSKGFIVVYLQSSQLTRHNGYAWLKRIFFSPDQKSWPDPDKIYAFSESSYFIKECYASAYDDLQYCYEELIQNYSVDDKKIIVGGFSGGATAAIEFALSNTIPVKGFISLCAQKPTKLTEDKVVEMVNRGVKAVFLEGEEDVPVAEVEDMMEMFRQYHLDYTYQVNQGIGHWYPDDLEIKLEKAVDYILGA